MLVEHQGDEEDDADENIEEVNVGDVAEGDDSAAHGEVPNVAEEQSIPSPTPPNPPPQHLKVSLQHPRYNKHHHNYLRVKHLEFDKVARALEIIKLKRRVQKLERMNKVRVLKLRRLQKVETSHRVKTFDDTLMDDESNQERMIAEMDQDDAIVLEDDKEEDRKVAATVKDFEEAKDETEPAEVQEVVEVVTIAKLITEVIIAANETVTTVNAIITTAEAQVPAATTATLTATPVRVAAAPSRRRKGVVIRDPKEESTTSTIIIAETKSKDKGKGILVEEPKPLKKKQQIEQDEQYARELHAKLNKDIDWDDAIDHVKRKAKEDPAVKRYQVLNRKPQTEAQAKKNIMMYLKNVAGLKMDYFKGMSYDDIQRVAKRRKLDEEVEDLKRHLQIVPNVDDDVYTEATPLARKVHVVDYEIIEMNNKPYYKITRADESKKCTWSSKGQELEATSACGMQIITFTTTQLILLVDRRYPLLRFTLDQMLNVVRLQVEEESEVSLELSRFTRQ
nr:hypothetical protein [Tanacetum cinerariifolium]